MATNLKKLGVEVEELEDGLKIYGKGYIEGATVSGYKDHRIIMAMAIGALQAKEDVIIDDIEAVAVTFPRFF